MIYLALALWLVWWFVWLVVWPRNRVANWLMEVDMSYDEGLSNREPLYQRGKHWLPLVVGVVFLFATTVVEPKYEFNHYQDLKWLGLIFTGIGLCYASHSRKYLGDNWSALVEVKWDHELICSGPYAVVRHPIYSGLITAFGGVMIVAGTYLALVGWILTIIAFMIKANHEEKMLAKEFPIGYESLKAKVPYKIFYGIY